MFRIEQSDDNHQMYSHQECQIWSDKMFCSISGFLSLYYYYLHFLLYTLLAIQIKYNNI